MLAARLIEVSLAQELNTALFIRTKEAGRLTEARLGQPKKADISIEVIPSDTTSVSITSLL